MDILQKLSGLGFSNSTLLDEKKGLVRIRTARGWVYERFQTEEQVGAWSGNHKPGAAE